MYLMRKAKTLQRKKLCEKRWLHGKCYEEEMKTTKEKVKTIKAPKMSIQKTSINDLRRGILVSN